LLQISSQHKILRPHHMYMIYETFFILVLNEIHGKIFLSFCRVIPEMFMSFAIVNINTNEKYVQSKLEYNFVLISILTELETRSSACWIYGQTYVKLLQQCKNFLFLQWKTLIHLLSFIKKKNHNYIFHLHSFLIRWEILPSNATDLQKLYVYAVKFMKTLLVIYVLIFTFQTSIARF